VKLRRISIFKYASLSIAIISMAAGVGIVHYQMYVVVIKSECLKRASKNIWRFVDQDLNLVAKIIYILRSVQDLAMTGLFVSLFIFFFK
jgi:hypothetical protein